MTTLTLAAYSTTAPKAPVDYSRPLYYVRSASNPNQFHAVAYTCQGILRCDCKASDFPRSAGRCRHLKAVRSGQIKPAQWKRMESDRLADLADSLY